MVTVPVVETAPGGRATLTTVPVSDVTDTVPPVTGLAVPTFVGGVVGGGVGITYPSMVFAVAKTVLAADTFLEAEWVVGAASACTPAEVASPIVPSPAPAVKMIFHTVLLFATGFHLSRAHPMITIRSFAGLLIP
jgi:hypothetical protein